MSKIASAVGVSMVFLTGIVIINDLSYQKKQQDKQRAIERQRTIAVGPPFKNCRHMQQYFNTVRWYSGEKVKVEGFENMEISNLPTIVSCGGYLTSGPLGYITITSPQGNSACRGSIYYYKDENRYSYTSTACRWIG
jgi:hypothetical protein